MNQVFEFNRFTLLVSKHWSENRKKYLLGLLAMAGMLFFWYSFILLIDDDHSAGTDTQASTFFFGLSILGFLFGSMIFAELSSGPKAMNYLSFPASHFEKLACGLLYGVVFFFIAYVSIYYLVTFAMVSVSNSIAGNSENLGEALVKPAGVVNVFGNFPGDPGSAKEGPNLFNYFIFVYLAVQSAYILGSVYFSKFSFIKTTIALAAAALVIALFVSKVLYPLLPDGGIYNSLTSFSVYTDSNYETAKVVSLPEWVNNILSFIYRFALAPILWIATYFRFKEKEV
ncbi:hypothetical protein ACX0G7_15330 [Flavitalea antarctica]